MSVTEARVAALEAIARAEAGAPNAFLQWMLNCDARHALKVFGRALAAERAN